MMMSTSNGNPSANHASTGRTISVKLQIRRAVGITSNALDAGRPRPHEIQFRAASPGVFECGDRIFRIILLQHKGDIGSSNASSSGDRIFVPH